MYDQTRIERLKAEIGLKHSAIAEYRAALQKLQNEVEDFARQYDRLIGPLEAELDRVRQTIEELQSRAFNVNSGGSESIWGQYSSFEEAFDAKYRQPQNPMISFSKPAPDETGLRALYRRLARKYHPDTTTDPAEKARLTVIMARINAAYRAKNADELYALDGKQAPAVQGYKPPVPETPREPGYTELLKEAQRLDDEIVWIKSEHHRLLHGPLMALKVEYKIARSQGRDLLREIAAKVRAELNAARLELEALRK